MKTQIIINILLLAKGDPSALECLVGLMSSDERMEIALEVLPKLYATEIVGEELGYLFRELSKCNYQRMAKICRAIPDHQLIDLCKGKIKKGEQLVERYLLMSFTCQN